MKKLDDPIVEETHRARATLLKKYGGPDGYAEHLRQVELELADRITTRPARRPTKTSRKAS